MALFHAVVWTDHQSAQVVQFDAEHLQAQKIRAHTHHTAQHGSIVRTEHEFFGEVCEALNGIAIETRVVPGPAAEVIAEQAEGADLIVIGSRGYGPQHSVLVGGVSRKIVDNAPCPVLVVPRVPEPAADKVVATGAAGATAQPA